MTPSAKTDVLIVGSGPVGATFARLLGRSGRCVTIVDSGPYLSQRPGRHLANAFAYQQQPNLFLATILSQLEVFSVPLNDRREVPPGAFVPPKGPVNFENPEQRAERNMPFASASYAVGGMGTHWTCCTPDPADMERTGLIESDEWPVLLAIARRLLNVHVDAFSPSISNEVVKDALLKAGVSVDDLPMAAEKRASQSDLVHLVTWTGTDTVLGPLIDGAEEERRRLTILAEHRVERLLWEGHRVLGAEVLDLADHTSRRIYADDVVVAAGPLLTPMVLWRSNIRPDALGRYLNANHTISSCIVLSAEIVERIRCHPRNGGSSDPIVPIPWNDPPVMVGSTPTRDQPWRRQIQRKGRYLSYDLLELVQIPEPFTDARLELDLIWFGMIESGPENRITFSSVGHDRFGQPQMTIDYTPGDVRELEKAMTADMNAVGQIIGRFIPIFGEIKAETPGSTLHYQGTCRMGTDRATSVVDPDCRVWDFSNLYLGSVGVIPNPMATNPTLTACALAVHAAARIAGRTPQDLAITL